MRTHFLIIVGLLAVVFLGTVTMTGAHEFQVGQSIVLTASKPIGVPLHREPGPSYVKHIPSGTPALIEKISKNDQWLQIRLVSGESHWVHAKYVELPSVAPNPPAPIPPPTSPLKIPDHASATVGGEGAAWSSREQCETILNKGNRMAPESSSHLRVATWNLRWFPVGQSPEESEDIREPTNLNWLTCAIRWMQVDILATQEILATPEATQALETLTANLTTQTGQSWRWYRQPCGHLDDHHIGLLWNDTRVALTNFDSLWQFNSKAENGSNPCTYGLRPGQYVRVQSRTTNGVDFHLIALHLKSGPTVFDVEERHKALNRIDQAIEPFLKKDQDIVILGDFNTMGAGDWHSRNSEIKNLRRHLEKENPGFTDLEPNPQCSHYFRGRGGWLDHILVSHDMKEISVTSTTVTGYCAVAGCERIRGDYPLAYRQLSDHCPVVVEIENIDRD
ncbi:MAG: endonuclease/exonuclease/phosphatase family protein [Nitrospirales bacterium]|nr:endonuclease/exonuclease/phosphatase family protein [Nitrospirales bacterium]